MSGAEPSKDGKWLGRGMLAALVVGLGGVLYVTSAASIKPDDGSLKPVAQKELARFASGELRELEVPPAKRPSPSTPFTNADAQAVRMIDYKGEVLVVNLWATWCPPCKTEMPSLARLQAAYPEREVRVIAVSIDGPKKLGEARAFIAANAPLEFHHSADAALAWAVNAKSFPTTVIYDRQGFERARLGKPVEWDAPQVRSLLDRLAADPA